ncbi:MAG: DUF192 domain-containing protein [Dehalococcoidia bacterium]|nr:DUF192 domain-containing protein [Dehalococcoidia bacterium]
MRNLRTGALLAERLIVASTFWEKGWGLLGRASLPPGEGLLITPCNSIHSFFMRFRFDAVFVDREWRVVYLSRAMRPFRVSRIVGRANSIVELPEGVINATATAVGDNLSFTLPE